MHIEAKFSGTEPVLYTGSLYASNSTSQYLEFVDEVEAALQRVAFNESTLLLGAFSAHVRTDNRIGVHGRV